MRWKKDRDCGIGYERGSFCYWAGLMQNPNQGGKQRLFILSITVELPSFIHVVLSMGPQHCHPEKTL